MQSIRKKSFAAEQLAKRQKKNPALLILLVVLGFIVIIGGAYVIKTRFLAVEKQETEQVKSIAVIPFDNLSDDKAYELLEKSCENKKFPYSIKSLPEWEPIRSAPRYKALLGKMGLPE